MRDLFREHWKSASSGAAGSFFLSLLIGLISRNPFGVVLGRALLLAVVFAGLAVALRYLVRTHLLAKTEAGSPAPAGGAETRDDRRGERVDIVLPDEGPLGRELYGSGAQESRPFGPTEVSTLEDGLSDDSVNLADIPSGAVDEGGASEGLGELEEELAEGLATPAPGQSVEADQETETAGGRWSGGKEHESRGASDANEEGGGGNDSAGPRPRISDRGGLPDISSLDLTEEVNGGERGAPKSTRLGGQRPQDVLRGALSSQDPGTMARAIRTVLKRDDKG